jgi:hypothetical protein
MHLLAGMRPFEAINKVEDDKSQFRSGDDWNLRLGSHMNQHTSL